MIIEIYARTNTGIVQQCNQDNFLILDLSNRRSWAATETPDTGPEVMRIALANQGLVLIVSDGMGEEGSGEVASRMAVESVRDLLTLNCSNEHISNKDTTLIEQLRKATISANFKIYNESLENPKCSGMGATLTGAVVKDDMLDLVQVGDSRAYLIRGNQIRLITKDQTLVQQLVDVGQIDETEAQTHMFRNVLLQVLGAQSELVPVMSHVRLSHRDILFMCSDGLSDYLTMKDVHKLITDSGSDLFAAGHTLIAEGKHRGSEDDITVILAKFLDEDLGQSDGEIVVELPSDVYESSTEVA
jgi:PPM family protein phosphatase